MKIIKLVVFDLSGDDAKCNSKQIDDDDDDEEDEKFVSLFSLFKCFRAGKL